MQAALLEAALSLPPEERRELIDHLSASLGEEELILSPEQEAELERRERLLEEHGPRGEDWETVKVRLLTRRRS